jgi:hypothetical protein
MRIKENKHKAWNRSQKSGRYLSRPAASKEELPSILIVCEGAKTEPLYFESFRVPSLRLAIIPAGRKHLSVVEMAIRELEKDSDYEQVWCVFDRDKNLRNKTDIQNFNSALSLAETNNFKVAYSNDAFELWYLLHFIFFDSQISRKDYIKKLDTYIKGGYVKNDPDIYTKLESKLDVAIKNAKKLYKNAEGISPVNADPSTTVFKLVEELRKYSRN